MKKSIGALLILLFALLPAAVFAAELSLTAEATAVTAGDDVVLTFVVSGENIAAAEGVFSYDPAVLSYVGGTGGVSDGGISMLSLEAGGADYLTAVAQFTAIANGEAVVDATIQNAYDYDGNSLGGAQAAVSITVSGADGGQPSTPSTDYSKTGVAAQNVEGALEPMYVWRSLQSLTLPSGYADRQVQYKGEFVGGAAIPDTEMPILLYLSNATGDVAGYYVYNAERDILYPYTTVSSVLASYTLMRPDENVEIPEGYTAATLEISGIPIPVWKQAGMDAELYLLYARNSAGELGFFLYNVSDRSVQRYLEATPSQTPLPEVSPAAISLSRPLFIALVALAALLLLALIGILIMHFRVKRKLEAQYRRRLKKLRSNMPPKPGDPKN